MSQRKDFVIDQFIWPYQWSFRTSVEYGVNVALDRIGMQVHRAAKVLLVGFANQEGQRHQICIEPETGPLLQEDLSEVHSRTIEIQEADIESQMFHSHPRVAEVRRKDLFLRSRSSALVECIQNSGKFTGLTFFSSVSSTIANYEVHTCVGLPTELVESIPRFSNPKKGEYNGGRIEESFALATINTCLGRADQALTQRLVGERSNELGDTDEIVRESARRFVDGVNWALAELPSDLFRRVCAFSSLTYERSSANGCIAISNRANLANKLQVAFENPISLSKARTIRKLLEISDDASSLLANCNSVYGLGNVAPAPNVAHISIVDRAEWSLAVDGISLIRVANEHASLPLPILDKDLFADVAERTVGATDVERIWRVIGCALAAGRGMTIVVSRDPKSELERLTPEALAIQPEFLGPDTIAQLGGIDGATLLGPDARCHAFGVILDGIADGSGDPSRGARFNSALRYQRSASVGAVVIVISDDGAVDLIPRLMPRVFRHDVEMAVNAFCDASAQANTDAEEWSQLNSQVEAFSFYLSAEECERVNSAYELEMERRLSVNGLRINRTPLSPHPDMDETFFFADAGFRE